MAVEATDGATQLGLYPLRPLPGLSGARGKSLDMEAIMWHYPQCHAAGLLCSASRAGGA